MTVEARHQVFHFTGTGRVLHGSGALAALPEEVARLGAGRAFVVTGRSVATRTPHLERVTALLGEAFAGAMSAIRQHVPKRGVSQAAEEARAAGADLVIALGGGSPVDAAKGVAAELARDGLPLPQIAIPTTLSAGEFTPFAGVTDEASGVKQVRADLRLAPATVILDPEVTRETPGALWASTGIKALDHAVEALLAVRPHPLTDLVAAEAIRRLRRSLPASLAEPFDAEARADCQLAAWFSILGLPSVGIRLSHLIGHQIGARWDIPHGVTSCITLPHAMRHLAPRTLEQQARVAAAFGLAGPPSLSLAHAVADEVEAFIASLEVPTRLGAAGARREELSLVAEAVAEETAKGGSEAQSPEAILGLLEAMW